MQHFENAGNDPERAHAMYHEDAVLEFPQSGERFIGVANFREWRSNSRRQLRSSSGKCGARTTWVAEISVRYDQGPANFGVSVLELREGKIARETIYVTERWEPPEWRAQWRAAP